MIILDTNVVSEPLKREPEAKVLEWLNAQELETLFLTAITVAELLSGIETLPTGKRKAELSQAVIDQILPLFDGRVLPFDGIAAKTFAKVNANSISAGNQISFADGAIAAIAVAHGFQVATRNVKDFKGTSVQLLNPWI